MSTRTNVGGKRYDWTIQRAHVCAIDFATQITKLPAASTVRLRDMSQYLKMSKLCISGPFRNNEYVLGSCIFILYCFKCFMSKLLNIRLTPDIMTLFLIADDKDCMKSRRRQISDQYRSQQSVRQCIIVVYRETFLRCFLSYKGKNLSLSLSLPIQNAAWSDNYFF